MSLDRDALDRWITGGRYSKSLDRVRCPECGEWTPVTSETEYGATTWSPEECQHCGHEFTGSEECEPDEPDWDAEYDRRREDDEEMGIRR